VVYALGPVAGRLPEGGFGYIDNMTPERVEAQGQQQLVFKVYNMQHTCKQHVTAH
jgi:hypothetical protein